MPRPAIHLTWLPPRPPARRTVKVRRFSASWTLPLYLSPLSITRAPCRLLLYLRLPPLLLCASQCSCFVAASLVAWPCKLTSRPDISSQPPPPSRRSTTTRLSRSNTVQNVKDKDPKGHAKSPSSAAQPNQGLDPLSTVSSHPLLGSTWTQADENTANLPTN